MMSRPEGAQSEYPIDNFPIRRGFHPFVEMEHTLLEVERSEFSNNEELPMIYTFPNKPSVKYRKINAHKLVEKKILTSGKLLLSIVYTLKSTRNAEKIFNCRQIFQIDDEIFIFIEYKYDKPYDVLIDENRQKIESLEGLLICNDLYDVLDDFLLWLVEVDPIGFELLRRMNRDGFTDNLEITEEIWPMHDSDSFMDRWFNQMVDYADTIELSIKADVDNIIFFIGLKSAISTAHSFTSSDDFQRLEREDWVHVRNRQEDLDDEDDLDNDEELDFDNDDEIADLTDEEIEQLRKEAIERRAAVTKFLFVDLPPDLKRLILDLMDRVVKKIGEEDALISNHELMRFTEGSDIYTERQISSQVAKLLRLLT